MLSIAAKYPTIRSTGAAFVAFDACFDLGAGARFALGQVGITACANVDDIARGKNVLGAKSQFNLFEIKRNIAARAAGSISQNDDLSTLRSDPQTTTYSHVHVYKTPTNHLKFG